MTSRESLSPVDSTMDNAKTNKRSNGIEFNSAADTDNNNNNTEEEECDVEAWDTLSKSFRQVQTVLDQNRELIKQVNDNHQSKIPDNLAKNVGLIHEINGNISKVMSIYSNLSVKLSNIVHQRKGVQNDDVESTVDRTSDEFE